MMYKVDVKHCADSTKFRKAAITFQTLGQYTTYPRGTTEYKKFWDEETRRCIEGYTTSDGDYITGYYYFYLNYSPIMLNKEVEVIDKKGNTRKTLQRERDFPKMWDYDRAFFDAVEAAENDHKHLTFLKPRGRGASFKGSSMLCRNYFFIRKSVSMAVTEEVEFLTKDGIITKAWDIVDFINEHTAWAKKSQKINTKLHKRASFIVDNGTTQLELGYKSEIIGVSVKNDPDKVRGKRAKLIIVDEIGLISKPMHLYNVMRPSVEEEGFTYGLIILQGCVCAGTKVITNDGRFINIEELHKDDGIVGYNTYSSVKQNIDYFREPYETECYEIVTNSGRVLKCSHDHPIVYSTKKLSKRVPGKRSEGLHMKYWKWQEAKYFKVGDQVGIIDSVEIFGDVIIPDARFIGWLVGDGSYGIDKTPVLSNCDDEINNYVESNFDTTTEKTYITKDGKRYKETRIHNICPMLRHLGIYGQTKNSKRLPKLIFESDKYSVCEFIGGLFDTDGYVSDIDLSGNKTISLAAANKEMLDEVQQLLLKIGVHGKIYFQKPNKNNPKDKNGYYSLSISDIKSVISFCNNITLISYKQERLNKLKNKLSIEDSNISKYIHGMRFERVVAVNNIGNNTVYNITTSDTHTYIANGFITHNTGGTNEADYSEMRQLFYEPDVYNFLQVENEWDDGKYGTACGFFWPQYYNMRGFYDEHGNSNVNNARKYEEDQRQNILNKASDRAQIDRYVAERPFCGEEALMQTSDNIFPKKELLQHLIYIQTHKSVNSLKQVGDLNMSANGEILWAHSNKPRDITKYRLGKDDDKAGQIVIWEHPVENPPYGLYFLTCLTEGQKIFTNKGLINVENVTAEHKLLNKDGEFVDIKQFMQFDKIDEDVYTFKMSNSYRTTTFTKEHPIYVSNTGYNRNKTINEYNFNFEFITAENVKEGMWTKVPNIYAVEKEYVSEYDLPFNDKDFWWYIGLWLGDGWCTINTTSISICFNKHEAEYMERCKYFIENVLNKKANINTINNTAVIMFSHKEFNNFLNNTFGKYAHGKYIPEEVKHLKLEYKTALLQGYLDSDGCITKHTKGYYSTEFVSINLELLEGIQDMLFSLGIVSNLSKLRNARTHMIGPKKCSIKETYHLRLGNKDSMSFVKLFLNKKWLDSKINRLDFNNLRSTHRREKLGCFISEDSKYIYFQIKNIIKDSYTGTVYNFECDTNTFMCHHIMTHNCDPYDFDQAATSTSLGSCMVYKRFIPGEVYSETIVAEYTGRPNTVEEFYENVRKLALYYNAKILYENEKKGLFVHFAQKHQEYLLADQPDILRDIVQDMRVSRGKGIHMNKQIKQYGELRLRDWLNEEYAPGKKNLTKLFSTALLEELIEYNSDGNFDRVIAMLLIVIYREELYNHQVKDNKKTIVNRRLFSEPLFNGNNNELVNPNQFNTYTPWR